MVFGVMLWAVCSQHAIIKENVRLVKEAEKWNNDQTIGESVSLRDWAP